VNSPGLLLELFDDAHDVFFAHHKQFFAFDLDGLAEYFPKSTLSPTFTSIARTLPSSWILPLPTAFTSPCSGFSAALSGMTMPEAVLRSSSSRLMMSGRVKDEFS
jgi:hypothetical protein